LPCHRGPCYSQDLYTLARCKSPLPMGLMYKLGIPLPAEQVEVYHENVEWEEFNVSNLAQDLADTKL